MFGVWSPDIPFFHFKGSEKKHQGRVGLHWISLILRLDRSEFCVDFEERYAIASESKETNVTEGLEIYGDGKSCKLSH